MATLISLFEVSGIRVQQRNQTRGIIDLEFANWGYDISGKVDY
jgi:hypothetical protein